MKVIINPYHKSVTIDGVEVVQKFINFPDVLNHLASISCDYDRDSQTITDVQDVHRYVSHVIEKQYYYKHLPEFVDWFYAEQQAQLDNAISVEQQIVAANTAVQNAATSAEKAKLEAEEAKKTNQNTQQVVDNAVAKLTQAGSTLPVKSNGTDIARTLGERFADIVNVKDFGAVGDGVTDDTSAIQAAMDAGVESLLMPDRYAISRPLTLSKSKKVFGSPELITPSGLVFEDPLLTITAPDVYIEKLTIRSDAICQCVGVHVLGVNCNIGYLGTENIVRPLSFGEDSLEGNYTYTDLNATLGGYNFKNYIRGIKGNHAKNVRIGSGVMSGRATAFMSPGYNGILLEYCCDWRFDTQVIEDAAEHAIRFSGYSHDITFTGVLIKRCGGSGIKVNSGRTADDLYPCKNITFGDVIIVDCGDTSGITEPNRPAEAVRLSYCQGVTISSLSVLAEKLEVACDRALCFACIKDVLVGASNVTSYAGTLIAFRDAEQDYDTSIDASSLFCEDVYIGPVVFNSSKATSNYSIACNGLVSSLNNITLNLVCAELTNGLFYAEAFTGTAENLRLCGYIGNLSTVSTGIAVPWFYDLATNVGRVFCPISTSIPTNKIAGTKAYANTAIGELALLLTQLSATAGQNVFGPAIGFTVPSSQGRLGAVISSRQTGDKSFQTGLSFGVGKSALSSNVMQRFVDIRHDGGLIPGESGVQPLGGASNLWSQLFASTATINTSDAREKVNLTNPDEALMRAWGKVNFKSFQFVDAVEKKGEDARNHFGVVAQQVAEAFASEGLDASRYALFCYDKWEAWEERRVVIDKEAILDAEGNELEPERTHIEIVHHPAGDRYGIRYSEALALECAYQRWKLEKLEEKLAKLEV